MKTLLLEYSIYSALSRGKIDKYSAAKLLNRLLKVFNEASEELDKISNELNKLIIGEQ